jgi:hypothetical protein
MAAASDIVQSVLVGGGATTVTAAIMAWLNRKKADADIDQIRANAAQSMSEAATALVHPLTDRISRLERREAKMFRKLETHSRWDRQVAAQLRATGAKVPDPPPLYIDDADSADEEDDVSTAEARRHRR